MTDDKFIVLNIPVVVTTETDIDVEDVKPRVSGTLVNTALHLRGDTQQSADMYVALQAAFIPPRAILPMMEGYISAIAPDDNRGLVWSGRLPINIESFFTLYHYNRSGETQRIMITLVIER